MRKKPLKVALTVAVFGSLLVVCAGQDRPPSLSKTYDIDNTKVRVIIPPGMDVAMTPRHLEINLGSATFSYKFKLPDKESTRVLQWNAYVSDAEGRLVDKDSWQDAGEWSPSSEVEQEASLHCDLKPGTKLTIILGEVSNDTGVRKIDEEALEQSIPQILAGRAALPRPHFIAHVDPSKDEKDALMKRSLQWILTKDEFRNDVKLSLPAMLLVDDPTAAPPLPDVQLISEQFLREKLRVGEPIKYLKYKGVGINANVVSVYFQFHTPRVVARGTAFVPMGISITFTYGKVQSRYILREVETEHF